MWIVVTKSCSECNEMTVGLFDEYPSEEQLKELAEDIGGMFCIYHRIFEKVKKNDYDWDDSTHWVEKKKQYLC